MIQYTLNHNVNEPLIKMSTGNREDIYLRLIWSTFDHLLRTSHKLILPFPYEFLSLIHEPTRFFRLKHIGQFLSFTSDHPWINRYPFKRSKNNICPNSFNIPT